MSYWNDLRHRVFDPPSGALERKALTGLLRVALAETETDEGFERLIRQMVHRETRTETAMAWEFLRLHLEPYQRGLENVSARTLAERFLADPPPLPRARPPHPVPKCPAPWNGPRLLRLAFFYISAMLLLALLARLVFPGAFPTWSWTSTGPPVRP